MPVQRSMVTLPITAPRREPSLWQRPPSLSGGANQTESSLGAVSVGEVGDGAGRQGSGPERGRHGSETCSTRGNEGAVSIHRRGEHGGRALSRGTQGWVGS